MEKILAQKAVPKGPEWPSYGNLGKVTQNPHFQKKEQRWDQGKFFKNRPKSGPRLKGQKHSAANGIILLLVCTYSAKTGKDFGENSGSKSVRITKLWQISQSQPIFTVSKK